MYKTNKKRGETMKIQLDLTDREARLICTFIRRSIYEQYERNMYECGMSREEASNVISDTVYAFDTVRDQIIEALTEV